MAYLTTPTNARDLLLEADSVFENRFVASAKAVVVTSTTQVFTYDGTGTLFPSTQFITITAARTATGNSITWSTIPSGVPLYTASTAGTQVVTTPVDTNIVYLRGDTFGTTVTFTGSVAAGTNGSRVLTATVPVDTIIPITIGMILGTTGYTITALGTGSGGSGTYIVSGSTADISSSTLTATTPANSVQVLATITDGATFYDSTTIYKLQAGAAGSNVLLIQGDNSSSATGRYVKINSVTISNTYTSGHKLVVIDPITGAVLTQATFDTTVSTTALITALDAVIAPNIITLTSSGSTACDAALRTKLNSVGGTLTSTWTPTAQSHVFIGSPGLSAGQGFEKTDSVAVSVSAYFTLLGLIVNGANSTTPGVEGATALFAYCVINSDALPSAPSIGAATTPTAGAAVTSTSASPVWYLQPKAVLASKDWMFQVSGTKTGAGVYAWQTLGYLSTFKVGALSALSADLGSITAGSIKIGTSPVISTSAFTSGSGAVVNTDGSFGFGNTTTSIVGNGTGTITLTGNVVSSGNIIDGAVSAVKFATGIEPVTIVTVIPTVKSTNSLFNSTDSKLYRWNGTAYTAAVAAVDISGTLLAAQIASLAASQITGTLTNAQIAEVAAAKISGTLTNTQIADIASTKITGEITSTQITDSAITTAKINAGAITTAKIAALAITAAEIAANAITAVKIDAGAITTAKIAAGAITADTIAASAITTAKIEAGAVIAATIAAGAITTAKIAALAVTAGEIAANAVTTAKLDAGAVTADTIAVGAITTVKIAASAITADTIAANAITTAKINAGAVTADSIAANAITTAKINAGAVTADSIAANAVTAAKISVTSLSAINADLGSITAGSIAIGTTPAISGTTMTGSGAVINSNGSFSLGNSTTNITASTAGTITLNGDVVGTGNIVTNGVTKMSSAATTTITVNTAGGDVIVTASGTFYALMTGGGSMGSVILYKNGTQIAIISLPGAYAWNSESSQYNEGIYFIQQKDSTGTGAATYSIGLYNGGNSASGQTVINSATMTVLECKR